MKELLPNNPIKLVLGFDYGLKQVGVAIGQAVTKQARSLCVLKARDGIPSWEQIQELLKKWQPDVLVVGLPLNMDGTKSEMSERAEKFARRLNGRFNIPVYMHDERLSSFEAKDTFMQHGFKQDYHENPVDGLAAALVLESWLADIKE